MSEENQVSQKTYASDTNHLVLEILKCSELFTDVDFYTYGTSN